MKYYHKIETLYERDEKTKKLIMGKFRNPTIEYLKDNLWQFTEKVDGTNIIVYWDGHKVEFHGRTEKSEIPKELLTRLNELFGGEINEEMFEQKFGEKEVALYGEGYGGKIQGGQYKDEHDFILFDVMIGDNWQPRETLEDVANYFNIKAVPVVLVGTLQQGIDYVLNNRDSTIAEKNTKLEGIVGRTLIETKDRCGNRNIVKIKYNDFK